MALTAGTRLGPYEIVAALGAGGMGEVYRAVDTTLKRQVAIKVLPGSLAGDPDRLSRFQREAEVLASLNHPHIAAIYGVEHADGVKALVMELVEGDDLAQWIARGPLPLDDALPIALQIAEALEAAHGAGVIHRDLKPANIKVRSDGTAKVLDFGLAKLSEPGTTGSGNSELLAPPPTITSPAIMTGLGVILGTAAYMSPEQARGQAADKRADIWAFGAVVFEMLTGTRAFGGDTVSDTLASVLKTDPDWRALPTATPSRLRSLLRWCLSRDPRRRLRDIGDARVQLEEMIAGAPEEVAAVTSTAAIPGPRRVLPWALTAVLAATLAAVLIIGLPRSATQRAPLIRMSAELGAGVDASVVTVNAGDVLALSRDGTLLAFVAQKPGSRSPQVYVRHLHESTSTALPGTEGADSPFFSPDGQWLGFFADGKMKKTPVKGGSTITLANASISRGADWGEDDTIIFLPERVGTLMRVSATNPGAPPEPVAPLVNGEVTQRWPQLLPGGRAVLFTSNSSSGNHNDANLVVQPLPAGERKIIHRGGYHGRYLSSGHLVFLRDSTLFAAPFDLDSLTMTGAPVPVLDDVTSNAGTGAAWFAVSATGIFAYLPGRSIGGEGIPIHWMDRQGKATPLRTTPAPWLNIRFSPEGDRLAFQLNRALNEVWVYDWRRDATWPLTSNLTVALNPVWTPDGLRIAFASSPMNKASANVYWASADGTGGATQLTFGDRPQSPGSWDPSGRLLAFEEVSSDTKSDLMILPMDGDEATGWKPGKPFVFVNSPYDERQPMFSPDGRWLAYVSNEGGQNDVYVRPFKGPGRAMISAGGGTNPVWSRTKRELYYGVLAAGSGQIMVVSYTVAGNEFRPNKPQPLSPTLYQARGPNRMFDLHKDGLRFALAPSQMADPTLKRDHLTFLFNFFDELRRIAPRSR